MASLLLGQLLDVLGFGFGQGHGRQALLLHLSESLRNRHLVMLLALCWVHCFEHVQILESLFFWQQVVDLQLLLRQLSPHFPVQLLLEGALPAGNQGLHGQVVVVLQKLIFGFFRERVEVAPLFRSHLG